MSYQWILDSEATSHSCSIEMVDEHDHDTGKVFLGDQNKFVVDNVEVHPFSSRNCLSVSQLCEKGCKIVFEKDGCQIFDPKGELIVSGCRQRGRYYIDSNKSKELRNDMQRSDLQTETTNCPEAQISVEQEDVQDCFDSVVEEDGKEEYYWTQEEGDKNEKVRAKHMWSRTSTSRAEVSATTEQSSQCPRLSPTPPAVSSPSDQSTSSVSSQWPRYSGRAIGSERASRITATAKLIAQMYINREKDLSPLHDYLDMFPPHKETTDPIPMQRTFVNSSRPHHTSPKRGRWPSMNHLSAPHGSYEAFPYTPNEGVLRPQHEQSRMLSSWRSVPAFPMPMQQPMMGPMGGSGYPNHIPSFPPGMPPPYNPPYNGYTGPYL